ncbi:MAG: hypothetical protein HC778_04425 [Chamaesiphon sp. CSU_1_12]|nr:hypothetical protein [Chamaesiphon sp. CSU_1_12]
MPANSSQTRFTIISITATMLKQRNYANYCRLVRIYLAIALVFLGACITIDSLIISLFNGTIVKILHEGLFIVGWVAMWRPIEIFLYDWVPITYGRLRQPSRTKPAFHGLGVG